MEEYESDDQIMDHEVVYNYEDIRQKLMNRTSAFALEFCKEKEEVRFHEGSESTKKSVYLLKILF